VKKKANKMSLAPIVLFVYNRLWHTKQTIAALQKNDLVGDSHLFIFSDGAKSSQDVSMVEKVREYIDTIDGFKSVTIIKRESNFGLAKNVIEGVSEVIDKFSKVIVVEDDIVTSKTFLIYMNKLLDKYESNNSIYSVTGYTFPIKIPADYEFDVYFAKRGSSWGWATWLDRWQKVDWEVKDFKKFINNKSDVDEFNNAGVDLSNMLIAQVEGKINSWAIIWIYSHFINDAYCVYPIKSRVINIGNDRSGTHIGKTKKYDVDLFEGLNELKLCEQIYLDKRIINNFKNFFTQTKIEILRYKLSKLLKR
jgi:hypothetical protein